MAISPSNSSRTAPSTLFIVFGFLALLNPALAATDRQDAQIYTKPEPTVRVDSGPIVGTTTSLPAATASVVKFLGIPFADKAVRFQPPEKPRHWTRPLRTQKWRPSCIQQFNAGPQRDFTMAQFNGGPSIVNNTNSTANGSSTTASGQIESEDCLYLNVYAPATPSIGRGRAVMFWLYGGSLQFGHAGQVAYDGSSFASYQDVIIVTTNYRTNGKQ
jgi:carboxylesterase type B